jgi:hypothetical protein
MCVHAFRRRACTHMVYVGAVPYVQMHLRHMHACGAHTWFRAYRLDRVKAVTVSNKRTRGNVARWMYAFNVVRVVGFDKSALCAKEQILSQPQFLPGSLTRVSGPPACQTHSHMHRCTRRDMRPLGPTWGYVFVVTVAGRRKAPYFGRQTKLTNGATVSLRTQLPHRCSLLTASDALS